MLTAAQMFLLKTRVALPFSSWMWSSAASTSAVLSTGSHQQDGDAPGWELGPCSSSSLGSWRSCLGGDRTSKLRTAKVKAENAAPEVVAPCSWGSQCWLRYSRWRFPLAGFHGGEQTAGLVPVEWMMSPDSVMLAWRTTGAEDTTSHWAAFYRETGLSWSAYRAHFGGWNQSPLPIQAILSFYVSLQWAVLYRFLINNN